MMLGWMSRRPIPDDVVRDWTAPALGDARIRRELMTYGGSHEDAVANIAATEALARFGRPARVIWTDNQVTPRNHGPRLAALLGADLVELPDAYVLLGEDAPQALARELLAFLATPRLTFCPRFTGQRRVAAVLRIRWQILRASPSHPERLSDHRPGPVQLAFPVDPVVGAGSVQVGRSPAAAASPAAGQRLVLRERARSSRRCRRSPAARTRRCRRRDRPGSPAADRPGHRVVLAPDRLVDLRVAPQPVRLAALGAHQPEVARGGVGGEPGVHDAAERGAARNIPGCRAAYPRAPSPPIETPAMALGSAAPYSCASRAGSSVRWNVSHAGPDLQSL